MLSFAPRISPRLLEALARLDDPRVPIAETCRRVGSEAERLNLPRPSYERLRVLAHVLRGERREKSVRRPSTPSLLLGVAFRVRSRLGRLDVTARIRLPADPRAP